MSADRLPAWQHSDIGLMVQVGQRRDRLPDPIGDWLIGPGGLGLSDDPARDLLRVEGRLRHVIAQLSEEIITAERRINATRSDEALANNARRLRRRRAGRELQTALNAQSELVDSKESAPNRAGNPADLCDGARRPARAAPRSG
jgi:hypothetical protein